MPGPYAPAASPYQAFRQPPSWTLALSIRTDLAVTHLTEETWELFSHGGPPRKVAWNRRRFIFRDKIQKYILKDKKKKRGHDTA